MRKLALLMIGTLLFSTACFGGGEENTGGEVVDTDEPYFFMYRTAEFEMEVPDTWDRINSFTSEYPEEVRIAFRNNVKDGDFVANVNVLREDNPKNLTTADFAQKKLASHAETLLNYQLLSQEELTLNIGNNSSASLLNTFQGKHTSSGQTLEYMQVYLASGDQGWTITAAYTPNEDPFVIERMRRMLTSFTLN